MQIPIQPPDLNLANQARRETQAISPASPVPGIPENAQNLDPNVALQWAQPVLASQPSEGSRSVLESLVQQSGFAPVAEQPLSTSPKSAIELTPMGVMLQKLLTSSESNETASDWITWSPVDNLMDGEQPPISQAMGKLYDALSSLDAFSARHLFKHFFEKTSHAIPAKDAKSMDMPTQIQQWFASLEPESKAAQMAAQMLTKGEMIWVGQIIPGLPIEIRREDAWRGAGNGNDNGKLEKGTCIKLEVSMPKLGKILITALQWGEDISINVAAGTAGNLYLNQSWSTLERQIRSGGLQRISMQRTTLDAE